MKLKMKVIVSDPISEDGLDIFKQNNIEIVDATDIEIDENYEGLIIVVYSDGTTIKQVK